MVITRAIRKHGEDCWLHTVLEVCDTDVEANAVEQRWIAELRTDVDGYNVTAGGEGMTGLVFSAETCAKISAGKRGKRSLTDEQYRQIAEKNRGLKRTPEQCAKISAGKVGRPRRTLHKRKPYKPWSDESRANLSAIKRGVPMTDFARSNMKAAWVLRNAVRILMSWPAL